MYSINNTGLSHSVNIEKLLKFVSFTDAVLYPRILSILNSWRIADGVNDLVAVDIDTGET